MFLLSLQVLADYEDTSKEYWKLPTDFVSPLDISEISPPESTRTLHIPVFVFNMFDGGYTGSLRFCIRKYMAGPFLHFVNFLFPLFGYEGRSSEVTNSLTPAQLATIHYINGFIQTR